MTSRLRLRTRWVHPRRRWTVDASLEFMDATVSKRSCIVRWGHPYTSPVLARTEPLRRVIADAIPDRPFDLRWWDGAELPATAPSANGNGSRPPFTGRPPAALAPPPPPPRPFGLR